MATNTRRANPKPAPANDARQPPRSAAAAALLDDIDDGLIVVDSDALGSITKSEVMMQLEAAHRWPRNVKRFVEDATALATMDKPTAKSCVFTLPVRKGGTEPITGPSVRLAEMVASCWGNMHTAARIIDTGARDVTAQAMVWDLEKNVRMGFEVKRGIVTSSGQRYGDDMVRVTSMAAISIALRNAIFRVVPRALVNGIYNSAMRTATGVADNTFVQERDEIITFFTTRWHVPLDRILARLAIGKIDDMTPELLATLIGFGQAVKAKACTIEDAFPPIGSAPTAGPRAKGAALDVLVNANKSRREEAPSAADLTPAAVQTELTLADSDWSGDARLDVIARWSQAQMVQAVDWARAFADPTTADADVPVRPEFTVLGRQPGED